MAERHTIAGAFAILPSMEIAFRIRVLDPPRGVVFRMQRGRTELVPPARESATSITFDFTLRVELDRPAVRGRLLGPFAQGPPAARFVYVNSGKHAGQPDSPWDRRAKVSLMTITPALIEEALASRDAVIEAEIAGTGRDGGPACATVPLLSGWRVAHP
jgi:hypothetical protein